jgi:enamine deaminase RidA (YjgF/YER057c/UK114 family)
MNMGNDQRRPFSEASLMIRPIRIVHLLAAWTVVLLLGLIPSKAAAQGSSTRYINPRALVKPTGYTHVVVAPDGRTVYIAGQVAFDSAGKVVGEGDFAAQAEQVYRNLQRALESVGGSMPDLVKTTTYITDIKNLPALRDIRARRLSSQPPANTLLAVSSLARPELLIEIEAVAVLGTIVRQ